LRQRLGTRKSSSETRLEKAVSERILQLTQLGEKNNERRGEGKTVASADLFEKKREKRQQGKR